MRRSVVAGALLLAAFILSSGARAQDCFTVANPGRLEWSLNVRNNCPYTAYWEMCVTFTWQEPERFSGVLEPGAHARYRGYLPDSRWNMHWEYTWSDANPPDRANCVDP